MAAPALQVPSTPTRPELGIDYERLYQYRFRDVEQTGRLAVWREIARYVHARMGAPDRMLDPAAGRGEFIRSVPAGERWAVDMVKQADLEADGVKMIISDIMDAELPEDYFDGIWISNFLEHLPDQNAVASLLGKLHGAMTVGGRIAIMGPNFKYCQREYFDGDPDPRRGEGAPVRGRIRDRVGGAPVPAVLVPRPAAALGPADPGLPAHAGHVAAARQAVLPDRAQGRGGQGRLGGRVSPGRRPEPGGYRSLVSRLSPLGQTRIR
jgi:hypothetical protein